MEPRFFNRGSFLHLRLVFKREREKEKKGRKEGGKEERKEERKEEWREERKKEKKNTASWKINNLNPYASVTANLESLTLCGWQYAPSSKK